MRCVVLAILLAATMLSCSSECLPEPESDTTPPTAGLMVSYYVDGEPQSRTVAAGDSEVTVAADEDRNIDVFYSGQDEEGMRNLSLSVTVHRSMGGLGQTEYWNIAPTTVSCPTKLLLDHMSFEPDQGERTIDITLHTENWIGLKTFNQGMKVVVKR